MADWFSGDIIANGIRIHYYRTGGAKPPLVLSHGATDDGLCWTPVARALESEYDVIMPDARGHGLSEAPEAGYTSDDRAADLAGLIQALHLGRPAIGGHSMGAGSTLHMAASYPALVRCAILEDPGFRAPGDQTSDAEALARMERMRKNAAERKAMSREELIALARAQSPTWSEEELGPWADAKRRVSLVYAGAPRQPERRTWQQVLPKVACPTLLITADPDKGALVTPEMAEEAVRLLPGLTVVRLRGAGHNIRRERFDGFMEAVRTFLAGA